MSLYLLKSINYYDPRLFRRVYNSIPVDTFASFFFIPSPVVFKCPAIVIPPHGTLFPSFCKSTAGVHYGTHCFLSCNTTLGYRLEGTPRSVSCLENGSWSADTVKMTCRGRKTFFGA